MTQEKSHHERITDFLFELGSMRKLLRMHRQRLLTDDMSDNIASHSYRVAMIGWLLAQEEDADPYKVVMMCLLHDVGEIRSGDQNYIHKRYVKVFEDQIKEEQLGALPYADLKNVLDEYDERKTKEAIVAKDADLLDQTLLLREYELQGNAEAKRWLYDTATDGSLIYKRTEKLVTESARRLSDMSYKRSPAEWTNTLSTSKNR